MSAITKNLPWFVNDLGISIIGEKCYVSLVENLNVEDVECLKYSLSKGLGIGIVLGGSIMKVPQLLLILNAGSARGLSLPAYVLETLSYIITLVYSFRNEFPFSTYGENLFLTIQNVVITLLIVNYQPSTPTRALTTTFARPTAQLLSISLAMLLSGLGLLVVPHSILSILQLSTLPLSLFSKFPQIAQNHRARSTGQVSAFAVLAQVGGCAARLFTTATEVGDPVVSAGFALALLLNLIIGVQMYAYWGKDMETEVTVLQPMSEKITEKQDGHVDIVVPPQSPASHQTAYQTQPASYGRNHLRRLTQQTAVDMSHPYLSNRLASGEDLDFLDVANPPGRQFQVGSDRVTPSTDTVGQLNVHYIRYTLNFGACYGVIVPTTDGYPNNQTSPDYPLRADTRGGRKVFGLGGEKSCKRGDVAGVA
ncbi:hypothetical protein EW146_g3972 [Bondarzewia mesenterica]|uniref:Mannose-P-dolichol utilization defect 1 protein homolog n=1 Tax=Bondarzewia mesenterica TaxID=1095465 RepID=A0A4S4LVW9_9AGAM|nr:hypothetical protein EW146_g3972 [Bondarzewia mesenterica]